MNIWVVVVVTIILLAILGVIIGTNIEKLKEIGNKRELKNKELEELEQEKYKKVKEFEEDEKEYNKIFESADQEKLEEVRKLRNTAESNYTDADLVSYESPIIGNDTDSYQVYVNVELDEKTNTVNPNFFKETYNFYKDIQGCEFNTIAIHPQIIIDNDKDTTTKGHIPIGLVIITKDTLDEVNFNDDKDEQYDKFIMDNSDIAISFLDRGGVRELVLEDYYRTKRRIRSGDYL